MKAESISSFEPLESLHHLRDNGTITRIANWISNIFCPPLLGLVMLLLIGNVVGGASGWGWVSLYVLTTLLLPSLYIYWLVQAGKASDFHLPIQAERIRPLCLTALLAIGVGLLAWWYAAPHLLLLIGTINIVQSLLVLLITLQWKISLHCMVAAELATLAIYLFKAPVPALGSPAVLTGILFVAVIAWARIYLRRHTVYQTMGGSALGTGLIWMAMQWI